jgi:hypothetical protein
VEADELATEFNAPLTTSLPEIPFDPMTKIQLVVGRKTVTSHLRSRLRYQLHYQPLAELLRHHYVYDHCTSVTKFIHEQLPTGSRLSKRDSAIYKSWCYRCNAETETSLHILVCPSESGLKWRQSLYSPIRTAHSKTPPSEFWDLLLFGLQKFLTGQPILPPQVSDPLRSIVRSQNAFGWLHLFQGRWSVE